MKKDAAINYATTGLGVLGGGAGGLALNHLLGNSSFGSRLASAAIGALLGGGLGAVLGNEEKKEIKGLKDQNAMGVALFKDPENKDRTTFIKNFVANGGDEDVAKAIFSVEKDKEDPWYSARKLLMPTAGTAVGIGAGVGLNKAREAGIKDLLESYKGNLSSRYDDVIRDLKELKAGGNNSQTLQEALKAMGLTGKKAEKINSANLKELEKLLEQGVVLSKNKVTQPLIGNSKLSKAWNLLRHPVESGKIISGNIGYNSVKQHPFIGNNPISKIVNGVRHPILTSKIGYNKAALLIPGLSKHPTSIDGVPRELLKQIIKMQKANKANIGLKGGSAKIILPLALAAVGLGLGSGAKYIADKDLLTQGGYNE